MTYIQPGMSAHLEQLLGFQPSIGLMRMGAAFAFFAIALIVSLIFGRIHCSVLCPMGTLQEALWHAARLFKPRGKFIAPWRARYALPLLAGIGLIFTLPPLFVLTDPISTFGRGVRSILAVSSGELFTPPIIRSLAIFAIISLFAILRGRRFCDWCPLGTTLGLAAGVAPYGISLNKTGCVSCGVCEKKCPMNCIDSSGKLIDRSRCILCMSCTNICPKDAITYGKTLPAKVSGERRKFLSSALALAGGALYSLGGPLKGLMRPPFNRAPRILPPGAGNAERYSSRCIGCQACAVACPVDIIKMKGMIQPELDYTGDYCQYSCTLCGAACPTEAIAHIGPEEKRRTRVATSELFLDRCVVVEKSQACGACAEVCPTRALRMEPYDADYSDKNLTIPVYDEPYCIGCGACLFACPAEPRAFVMHPAAVQTLTPGMRPTMETDTSLPTLPGTDGFPF